MLNVVKELSRELQLPERVIIKAYRAYWRFIKEKTEALPLKDNVLDEEVFNKTKKSFNIAGLGKLYCCEYNKYKYKVLNYKERRDVKSKESQANG